MGALQRKPFLENLKQRSQKIGDLGYFCTSDAGWAHAGFQINIELETSNFRLETKPVP